MGQVTVLYNHMFYSLWFIPCPNAIRQTDGST